MLSRKSDRLRLWAIGVAATGMCWQSIPAIGQAVNPVASNQKKNVTKNVPAQIPQEPRQLPVTGGATSLANPIRLVAESDAPTVEKSEVQKQLEALYEQDGREMPEMNFGPLQPLQPNATTPPQQPTTTAPGARPGQVAPQPAQKPAARTTPGYTQYQPQPQARTQATPYPSPVNGQPPQNFVNPIGAPKPPQAQPRQNAVTGFFKRLTTPRKPLSKEAPIPPDYANAVPGANAVRGANSIPGTPTAYSNVPLNAAPQMVGNNMIPASATTQTMRPVVTVPQPNPTNLALSTVPAPVSNNVQNVGVTAALPELSKSIVALPSLAQQPLPLQSLSVPSPLPPLMTEVQPRTTPSKAPISTARSMARVGQVTSDFPNPFPDLPEAQADVRIASSPKAGTVIAPKKQEVISPKVEPAAPSVIEPPNEVPDESESPAVASNEDPFAVEAKGFNEPSINGDLQRNIDPTAPSLGDQPALAPVEDGGKSVAEPKSIIESPAADAGEFLPPIANQETHLEKMRRIRERFGMKGLKGFCPVTLRDDRELTDAKTEYHSVHRNQKFHFATVEAREKFEANPFRYVPAAYGADVVALSRDKDVLEGTLDFALWYKGRLYLFGSQANYDIFIAEPTKFATIEGIE